MQVQRRHQVAHRNHEQRQRKRDADPETPCHVAQFGSVFLKRRHERLERHAALGADTGTDLPHVRMHGAGVDSAFFHRRARRRRVLLRMMSARRPRGPRRVQIQVRIGIELSFAARAAKKIALARELAHVLRRRFVDLHAADQISCHCLLPRYACSLALYSMAYSPAPDCGAPSSEMTLSTATSGSPVIRSSEIAPNNHVAPARTTMPAVKCRPYTPSGEMRAIKNATGRRKRCCSSCLRC